MEKLERFPLLTRDLPDLTDRYSERKEAAKKMQECLNLKDAT